MSSINSSGKLSSLNFNDDSNDLKGRFLQSSLEICTLAKQVGINIIPTHDLELPHFSVLTEPQKKEAVKKIESMNEIMTSVINESKDLRDNSTIVWTAMKKFNFIPPSDFFSKLEKDDVIEIYDINNLHLFANLRFFDLSGYTLEQLHCFPWSELYERDAGSFNQILAGVGKAMQSSLRETHSYIGDLHQCRETCSPFKLKFNFKLKYIAPLFDRVTKEKIGFATIEAVEVLNQPSKEDQQAFLEKFYAQLSEARPPNLSLVEA